MDCNFSETIADKYGNMNKKTKSKSSFEVNNGIWRNVKVEKKLERKYRQNTDQITPKFSPDIGQITPNIASISKKLGLNIIQS